MILSSVIPGEVEESLTISEISRDVSTPLDMTIEMNAMQVFAPAKINLSLKILGRLNNNFHGIETLITQITLCDQIEIVERASTGELEFHCDDPSVPTGDDNLIVRAAKSFFAATKSTRAVSIDLRKRIPHGAGLG